MRTDGKMMGDVAPLLGARGILGAVREDDGLDVVWKPGRRLQDGAEDGEDFDIVL